MDAEKLANEATRGRQARDLLEHPLLQEAFQKIETEVQQAWQQSKAEDQDAREKLWLMGKLLSRLRDQISSIVTTGQMAELTLLQKQPDPPKPIWPPPWRKQA